MDFEKNKSWIIGGVIALFVIIALPLAMQGITGKTITTANQPITLTKTFTVTLTHTPVTSAARGEDIPISVTTSFPIWQEIRVYYWWQGSTVRSYEQALTLTASAANTFSGTIPADATANSLMYNILAWDGVDWLESERWYQTNLGCIDSCTSGAKQCSGTAAYQTCGNYDTDSCLEWSTATNCASGQTCSSGACQAQAAFNFDLTLPQSSGSVTEGQSITTTATVTLATGTAENVRFSCGDNLPVGVSCSYNPVQCAPSNGQCSSTITISTMSGVGLSGAYPITISGRTSGPSPITKTATYTLTVNPQATQQLVISNGHPTGTITTRSPTLRVSTNVPAACRFALDGTRSYNSMAAMTPSTDKRMHSYQFRNLGQGARTYYVKCKDIATNTISPNYAITFRIA